MSRHPSSLGASWVLVISLLGCHENHQKGGGGTSAGTATATAAGASSATTPAPPVTDAPRPPAPAVLGNPMAAYTPEGVAKYDAKQACLASCAAALRCRVDQLFSQGSRAVGEKVRACRAACSGTHVAAPGYLEKAKACLTGGSCERYATCAPSILPANL